MVCVWAPDFHVKVLICWKRRELGLEEWASDIRQLPLIRPCSRAFHVISCCLDFRAMWVLPFASSHIFRLVILNASETRRRCSLAPFMNAKYTPPRTLLEILSNYNLLLYYMITFPFIRHSCVWCCKTSEQNNRLWLAYIYTHRSSSYASKSWFFLLWRLKIGIIGV